MREGVGYDIALALSLQAVIADGGRRLHRRLDIARFDEPPLFLRMVCPYAGKTIGVQLDADLKLICVDFVIAPCASCTLGSTPSRFCT
jgi:hypothetical protein